MSFLLNPTTAAAPQLPKGNEPSSPLALLPTNEVEAQRFIKKYRKEGWLWKLEQKKRTRKAKKYFRIADSNLHWYRNPTDINPLRTIALVAASLRIDGPAEFSLVGYKQGKEAEWCFGAESADDARRWIESVQIAQKNKALKVGWLTLDRKKFWFLLRAGVLYWFLKEQDPTSDFRKAVVGCARLLSAVLQSAPDDVSFDISDSLGDETDLPASSKNVAAKDIKMMFNARNREEKSQWLDVFRLQIDKHKKRQAQGTEKFGWLKHKKLNKRFFVVLSRGRLIWLRGPRDSEERGMVMLEEASVRAETTDKLSFTVYLPTNAAATNTFIADTEVDAQGWLAALKKNIDGAVNKRVNSADELRANAVNSKEKVEKNGWLIIKGKRKYFQLKAELLMWFDDDVTLKKDAKMQGNLRLRDCVLTRSDFSLSIKASDGKVYQLQAHTKEEIKEWIASISAALQQARGLAYAQAKGHAVDPTLMAAFASDLGKQGWVYQDGKKRFLELAQGRLTEKDVQFRAKRVIPLEGCAVSFVTERSFLIRTVTESIVYDCLKEDTEQWAKNISYYIIKANAAATDSTVEKKGWLLVNGKSQWCALRLGKLHWFPTEQGLGFAEIPKSTIVLKAAQFTILPSTEEKRFAFELKDPKDPKQKKREFVADSEVDMNAWCDVITAARDGQKAAGAPALKVFGTKLGELLAHEKQTRRGQGDVPSVMKKCIEFLNQPAARDAHGLFHIAGNFARVREYINTLNAGQELNFDAKTSPHDVAQLLKQYLKQLPEPIIPFSSYELFLEARSDPVQLRSLIELMPEANYSTLKYIIHFLAAFSTNTENKDAVDVSMIFAPFILHAEASTEEAGVDDSDLSLLKGVLVVGTMINSYVDMFEGPRLAPGAAAKVAAIKPKPILRSNSEERLDNLLSNFMKDETAGLKEQQTSTMDAYGLDFTSNDLMRQTFKQRTAKLLAEPLVQDWGQELKVMQATMRRSRAPPKAGGAPSHLAVPGASMMNASLSATAARKRPAGGGLAMTMKTQKAVSELDDLFDDLMASRVKSGRSATAAPGIQVSSGAFDKKSTVRFTPGASARGGGRGATTQLGLTIKTAEAVSELDDLLGELKDERAASAPPPMQKTNSSAKFGALTVKTAAAVSDLDDLLGELHAPRTNEELERGRLLDELQWTKQTMRAGPAKPATVAGLMQTFKDEKKAREMAGTLKTTKRLDLSTLTMPATLSDPHPRTGTAPATKLSSLPSTSSGKLTASAAHATVPLSTPKREGLSIGITASTSGSARPSAAASASVSASAASPGRPASARPAPTAASVSAGVSAATGNVPPHRPTAPPPVTAGPPASTAPAAPLSARSNTISATPPAKGPPSPRASQPPPVTAAAPTSGSAPSYLTMSMSVGTGPVTTATPTPQQPPTSVYTTTHPGYTQPLQQSGANFLYTSQAHPTAAAQPYVSPTPPVGALPSGDLPANNFGYNSYASYPGQPQPSMTYGGPANATTPTTPAFHPGASYNPYTAAGVPASTQPAYPGAPTQPAYPGAQPAYPGQPQPNQNYSPDGFWTGGAQQPQHGAYGQPGAYGNTYPGQPQQSGGYPGQPGAPGQYPSYNPSYPGAY